MKFSSFGPLAVVGAALLWSLDGVLRQSVYSLPPMTVVFFEHLFGAVILGLLILPNWTHLKSFTKSQWCALLGVSLLSGVLGTYCYTAALSKVQYVPFSVVVLLQQLQPLFAIFTAAILLKEPLSKKFFTLAMVALFAAYAVSFPDLRVNINTGSATMLGAGLALLAAVCWGSSTAFSKYALKNTSWLHTTAVRFGFTAVFALIFSFLFSQTGSFGMISPEQWKTILLITLSTGMVALGLYYFGLQRVPASRATLLELAWPVSAIFIGYFFLGQTLSITQWIGSAVLVGTMYLVGKDARKIAG